MKSLTPRRGVLGGVLLLAVAVLAIDRGSGRRQPATAQAADARVPVELTPADWEPVSDLVARLTRSSYAPVGEDLARLDRDVFQPTPMIEEAVALAPPVEAVSVAAADDPNSGPEAGFAARHKLTGVMLASRPLAVVDDQVLAVSSNLDGYALIDVQRDYVVFQELATGARVTLELEQRPKKR
jgi:hypothetical protein